MLNEQIPFLKKCWPKHNLIVLSVENVFVIGRVWANQGGKETVGRFKLRLQRMAPPFE